MCRRSHLHIGKGPMPSLPFLPTFVCAGLGMPSMPPSSPDRCVFTVCEAPNMLPPPPPPTSTVSRGERCVWGDCSYRPAQLSECCAESRERCSPWPRCLQRGLIPHPERTPRVAATAPPYSLLVGFCTVCGLCSTPLRRVFVTNW